jgi:hypothetical protein
MKHRKLRIAWSVGWVLATLPLLVLWALSYSEFDNWDVQFGNSGTMRVWTALGRIVAKPAVGQSDTNWIAANPVEVQEWGRLAPRWSFGDGNFWCVPIWFPVAMASVFAIAPLVPWSTRYSLRAILLIITIIAVGLGLIVWLR